jgi:hypothetical protein
MPTARIWKPLRLAGLFVVFAGASYLLLSGIFTLVCLAGGHYTAEEIWSFTTAIILAIAFGVELTLWRNPPRTR